MTLRHGRCVMPDCTFVVSYDWTRCRCQAQSWQWDASTDQVSWFMVEPLRFDLFSLRRHLPISFFMVVYWFYMVVDFIAAWSLSRPYLWYNICLPGTHSSVFRNWMSTLDVFVLTSSQKDYLLFNFFYFPVLVSFVEPICKVCCAANWFAFLVLRSASPYFWSFFFSFYSGLSSLGNSIVLLCFRLVWMISQN